MKKEEKKKIAIEFFKKGDFICFLDLNELSTFIKKLEMKYDVRPIIYDPYGLVPSKLILFNKLIKIDFNKSGELEFHIVELFPFSYNYTVWGFLKKLKALTSDKKNKE